MVPARIPVPAFQPESGARGNRRAALVLGVALDRDAAGAQFAEREVRDAADGLGDVALALEALPAPVADLHRRDAPVDPVQTAAADERLRALQEEQQQQVLAL